MAAPEPTFIRNASMGVYQQRHGLSDQAVGGGDGKGAYPDLTPDSARQKYRRRKAKIRARVEEAERAQVAAALNVPDPGWLDSDVAHVLSTSSPDPTPLAIGGGVLTWPDVQPPKAAAILVEESGLFPRPDVVAVTVAELGSLGAGPSPWWRVIDRDEEFPAYAALDDVRTLLELEHYLRTGDGLDYLAWNFPALVFDHVAPVFRETPRGPEKDRLARLITRAVEIENDPRLWEAMKADPPTLRRTTSREW